MLVTDESSRLELIDQFVEFAIGLKHYEWCKIAHAVNLLFDSASNRIVLDDAETLKRLLLRELGVKPTD